MIVKNIDTVPNTYEGQVIDSGEEYIVEEFELHRWENCEKLFADILINKVTVDGMDKKGYRNYLIDKKTKELILQGFIYDSVLFSASETAQRNWLALDQFKNDLTYPFSISTKNDGEHQLLDATEVHSFVLTGLGTIEYHYGTGRALKQSINAATTDEEIDAVEDNR